MSNPNGTPDFEKPKDEVGPDPEAYCNQCFAPRRRPGFCR
jgi:hypothetical protein